MAGREGYHRKARGWRPSDAQRRVLDVLALGLTNGEIATKLNLSAETVKWHIGELLAETGVPDRQTLASWWQAQKRHDLFRALWTAALRPLRIASLGVAVVGLAVAVALVAHARTHDASPGSDSAAVQAAATPAEVQPTPTAAPQNTPPPPDPPWFAQPKDRNLLETIQISGPDFPYPLIVTRVEYLLAASASAGQDSIADVRGVSAPDTGEPRYAIDYVRLKRDGSPDAGGTRFAAPQYEYVQGHPPRLHELPDDVWLQPTRWFAGLLDRYIALGKIRAIGPQPTLSEVVQASQRAFGASVTLGLTYDGVNVMPERTLLPGNASRLLAAFGEVQAARFGAQGTLLGQKSYSDVPIQIDFGPYPGPKLVYLVPGSFAPYGVGFSPRQTGAWQVSSLVSPPAYTQEAFMLPESFDQLMLDLGYNPRALTGIASYRIVPYNVADIEWRRVVWVSARKDGGSAVQVPVTSEICPNGCGVRYIQETPAGLRYIVQLQPSGLDPYPEAVKAADYYYFPDYSECPAMEQVTALGILNGQYSPPPGASTFCVPPELDAILRSAVSQLP
jgi:DNA-binding CsgD family transcriptional regulator